MVKKGVLLTILLLLLIGYSALEFTKVKEADDLYGLKIQGSMLLEEMFQEVKDYRIQVDGGIDTSIDLNSTGMIGQRFTRITTTLGNLESKRTSANPNMAAMVIELMTEAGIKSGDRAAVNVSGSFPAMNLAVIAAAEVMDVDLTLISSIGSSTYGANNERLTYLDMEKRLFHSGVIENRSIAFSYGGADDVGSDIDQKILESIRARQGELVFIHKKNYEENIEHRLNIYNAHGEIDLFINVGGNIVSGGDGDIGFGFDNGIIRPNIKLNYSDKGLIGVFLSEGTNVINILNIKSLASQYGMSIDPVPLPRIGEEAIYFSYYYNKYMVFIFLLIGGGGIIYYGNKRKKRIEAYLEDIKKQSH